METEGSVKKIILVTLVLTAIYIAIAHTAMGIMGVIGCSQQEQAFVGYFFLLAGLVVAFMAAIGFLCNFIDD